MATNPNFTGISSTPPVWMGDFSGREHILPFPAKLDSAQFNAVDAVRATVTAAAAVDATTIAVSALSGAIPNGTVLDFGGKKFARLTASAAQNATTLTVAPLATALAANDAAIYAGTGKKSLPSGVLVGRTFAEQAAGAPFGPADVANDEEIYLTARESADLTVDNDTEMYRPNSVVKENYLPGWATQVSAYKAKVRALYRCIGGKD